MNIGRRRLLYVVVVLAAAAVLFGIYAAVASSRCGTSQTWSLVRGCYPHPSGSGNN
jgi:hypothetical protein